MDDWVEVDAVVGGNLPIRQDKSSSSAIAESYYEVVEKNTLSRLHTPLTRMSAIFHVDLGDENLYTTYLKHLAPELQQEYTCQACKRFVNKYGDLALVNSDGKLEPLFWSMDDLSGKRLDVFGPSTKAIRKRFGDARVVEEFKVQDHTAMIGTLVDGSKFEHFRLRFPTSRIRKKEPSGFTSANTSQLASMLERILADYSLETVQKANLILQGNKLPYADNHRASTKWLLELVKDNKIDQGVGEVGRHNLLYGYAAASFTGSLKQMRSGALGTLLEHVKDGRSFAEIRRAWMKVCDPIMYMRPQAAPSQGNVDAAEKLFTALGLTKEDLRRRLLVQDDVPAEVVIWSSEKMVSKQKARPSGGIFGAVVMKTTTGKTGRPSNELDVPLQKITFTRFVTRVLPKTKRVDCWLDSNTSITTCTTGLTGSKPLMKWHDVQGKNRASHYVWTPPPNVSQHNLKPRLWNEVRCLIPLPSLWDGVPVTTTFPLTDPDGKDGDEYNYYHRSLGFRYLFVLEDNHESELSHLHLFPQLLKSEFHGVRSTIEAYTKTESLQDVADGLARGGFVGGVEASRSSDDQKLKMRVQFQNGEEEVYHITLFE